MSEFVLIPALRVKDFGHSWRSHICLAIPAFAAFLLPSLTAAKLLINEPDKQMPLDPKEIPQVIAKLVDHDSTVAFSAQYALVKTGRLAVPYLGDAILHDSNPAVRGMSIDVLGRIKDASGLPVLVKTIHGEKDQRVRSAAFAALGDFGEAGIEPLSMLLDDPDPAVRTSATEILSQASRTAYIDTVSRNAIKNNKTDIPSSITRLTAALTKALNDTDPSVRFAAVSGLATSESTDADALAALKKATADKNVRVRLAAQQAVDQLDPSKQQVIPSVTPERRSTKATGSVDFSTAKTSFDVKQIIQGELGKYHGDGKIELKERKYGPGASTFGYTITLPEFIPDQSQTKLYKLTGFPVWDQRGLGRTAHWLLQTLIGHVKYSGVISEAWAAPI